MSRNPARAACSIVGLKHWPSNRRKSGGYNDEVLPHLAVAYRVQAGLADAAVGVRVTATIFGLDFVPLQHERYDLVMPKNHDQTLHGLKFLRAMMVSKPFREELEALGGYDTREIGKVVEMRQ